MQDKCTVLFDIFVLTEREKDGCEWECLWKTKIAKISFVSFLNRIDEFERLMSWRLRFLFVDYAKEFVSLPDAAI